MKFTSEKPHFKHLKRRWQGKAKKLEVNLWSKHGKPLRQIALGSLGGLYLLTSPVHAALPPGDLPVSKDDVLKTYDKNVLAAVRLKDRMPDKIRPLTKDEEDQITRILSEAFSVRVTAEVDNIRLNGNYGLIGGEQHLYRYPGDNLYAHMDTTSDWAMFGPAGIAPNLGAWGYFSPSKAEFTNIDKLREKYYLAVQTFKVPGYAENAKKFQDFFKFRKMLVVNPKSGQAVVAVIADAGPSEWTGKHLGGSPEVMDVLGLSTGPRKGAVLYFFLDDASDKIPLGPIKVTENKNE